MTCHKSPIHALLSPFWKCGKSWDKQNQIRVNIDEIACSKGAITYTKKNKAISSGGVKSHTEETRVKLQPSFEDAEENDAAVTVTENEAKYVSLRVGREINRVLDPAN